MPPEPPDVTIGVLTAGHPDVTDGCLRSLLRTRYPRFSIVVVNNSVSRRLNMVLSRFQADALRARRPCVVVSNGLNLGAASGRNQILRLTRSTYVAFVDNDTVAVSRKWLSALVGCLESDAAVAIAGAKLLFRHNPRVIQAAGGGVSPSGRPCDMGRNLPRTAPAYNRPRDVQFQTSACMLLRRSVVDVCGYFDPAFDPVLYEEIDYCYRVREHGFLVRYVPGAVMLHTENVSTFRRPVANGPYLLARHGMLFRKRWRHMFTREAGPSDQEAAAFNQRAVGRHRTGTAP